MFKDYIENQDGYRLFNRGAASRSPTSRRSRPVRPAAAAPFDLNREVNNGRGPVDFKSFLGRDKCLIEFKLASNSSLKRNLEKQVDIYEAANQTKHLGHRRHLLHRRRAGQGQPGHQEAQARRADVHRWSSSTHAATTSRPPRKPEYTTGARHERSKSPSWVPPTCRRSHSVHREGGACHSGLNDTRLTRLTRSLAPLSRLQASGPLVVLRGRDA